MRACCDLVGLKDWTFIIREPADDFTALAEVDVKLNEGHGNVFHLYLCENFVDKPPEEQRTIIAHELAHVILGRMDLVVWKMREAMKNRVAKPLYELYANAEEEAVHVLERLIAPTLPLPPSRE